MPSIYCLRNPTKLKGVFEVSASLLFAFQLRGQRKIRIYEGKYNLCRSVERAALYTVLIDWSNTDRKTTWMALSEEEINHRVLQLNQRSLLALDNFLASSVEETLLVGRRSTLGSHDAT